MSLVSPAGPSVLAQPTAALQPRVACQRVRRRPSRSSSHHAIYDVSLVRASQSDDVRGARGTMSYTFTDRCDGYTVESALHLDMSLANGDDSQLEQRYAAWEAKNNRSRRPSAC